jgi:fructose-1,6-bisphosphatase I
VTTLHDHLAAWSLDRSDRKAVADTVAAIAEAGAKLAAVISLGPLAGDRNAIAGPGVCGDAQTAHELRASNVFVDHLRDAPVAAIAPNGAAEVLIFDPNRPLVVAIDLLDGVGNVTINAPSGAVFSLLPTISSALPEVSFLAPGTEQCAAGFILYGPHTSLVLTLGDGVNVFTLEPRTANFVLTHAGVRVPLGRREYAINASNGRHWPLAVRAFVEECVAGADGPRGVDYNTRWLGAVVSEAYRILAHGGIYLYPGDARPGFRRGRLQLLHEANPIAMLIEQAGGAATDGFHRILGLVPNSIDEHVPLIFGSRDKVARVMELYAAGVPQAGQRPLFATRGLFKS